MTTNENDLVLVRSDLGDGGWSLHRPGATDEDIAIGESPPLLSGTAVRVGDGWSRPDSTDYGVALRKAGR